MGYIGAGPTRFNTADELTVTGNAEFNGNLTVKGTTTTIDSVTVQNFDMGDNDKIRLGDSQDLVITHDGTDSIINDAGAGSLKFQYGGTDGVVFDSSGNVGIGVAPNNLLEVRGTSSGQQVLHLSNAAGASQGGAQNDIRVTAGGNTYWGDLNINAYNMKFSPQGSEAMRIDSSGNVGIGTSNPNSGKLHVSHTTGTIGYFESTQAAANVSNVVFNSTQTNSSANATFQINHGTTAQGQLRLNGDSSFAIHNKAGLAESLRITSSGNVGIGITSPATPLHVLGAANVVTLAGSNATTSYSTYQYNTSTIAGYIGNGSGILSGASSSDFIMRSEGSLAFASNGNTERLRIDSSGNLIKVGGVIKGERGTAAAPAYSFSDDTDTGMFNDANLHLGFSVGGTERMRIDSNGNLLVNTTSGSGSAKLVVSADTNVANPMSVVNTKTGVGTEYAIIFYRAGSIVGSIQTSLSATSYLTSSDYRLKENVTADWDATTRLKQLNPVRFNFIADADTTVDGFLAHEVQDIVPEAITGTKDGMRDEEYEVTPAVEATYDDDGNILTETVPAVMGTRSVPDYQGIDQAKLVPLLVKTIQELEARIAALETA